MKELNKSGSILVYSKLDAEKFDKYIYTYDKKKITIGVNLDNLLIILKCMTNLDKMTWALDDEDINKLIIILENTDKKEKKIFRLNLSDLDEEKIEVDTIEFPYSAYFPSSDFHKYCKDMSLITEKIEIKCTNNKVSFGIKGAEICDADFEISESNGGLSIEVNTDNKNEIVQGVFSLKWLNVFTKCTNLSPQVILYLKNDYPLIIQYSVAALGVAAPETGWALMTLVLVPVLFRSTITWYCLFSSGSSTTFSCACSFLPISCRKSFPRLLFSFGTLGVNATTSFPLNLQSFMISNFHKRLEPHVGLAAVGGSSSTAFNRPV
jgi:proliferating cell nuclear antigen